MAAVIGALRVDLGLNSAEFQAGLQKASTGLGNFTKAAGVGLAAVAGAAVAAGAALSVAVKGAIDHADSMDELAQQVGVSVEALTSLGYAAKLSGSDADTLATGLRKLSQNMLSVAQGGTGPMATAFKALGINVKGADGALRSADAVLIEIASKFAAMENGATKTALAVQLFGRSGTQLIPFLNQGRDGISALTAEADRLGITLDSTTAEAAGEFNDSLDRLQAGLQGMVNKITAAALPTLNSLVETLTSPDFQAAMKDFAIACITIADGIAQVFIGAHKAFKDFLAFIGATGTEGEPKATREGSIKTIFPEEYGSAEGDIRRQMEWSWNKGTPLGGGADPYAGFGLDSDGTIKIAETKTTVDALRDSFDGLFDSTAGATSGANTLKTAMEEGKAVFEATRTPAETYRLEVERLNELLQKGAIDQDTYNRAVLQAQDAFQQAESSGSRLANTLASSLANVFSKVVDGSKTAVEAVGDLIKSLGQMAIHEGFKGLFGGLMGGIGGGGGLGGIFSGLFGGGPKLKLGFNIPGFAGGTDFAPGGLALVGERGPELVNLPRGSQVIPNHELRAGGETISIQINGSRQDAAEIAREVRRVLPDALAAANRNPYRRTT